MTGQRHIIHKIKNPNWKLRFKNVGAKGFEPLTPWV